jgi:hypothetical protein
LAARRLARRFDRTVNGPENIGGIHEERLTSRRQLNAARVSAKQTDAEFALQRLDLLRERWLLDTKAQRGTRHVLVFGDGDEVAQMSQLHILEIWSIA